MRLNKSFSFPAYIGVALIIVLTSVTLLLWSHSPIYPDEVAFRIARMRFIQDNGTMRGLFAICDPNGTSPPILLRPAAWVLSWIDLQLTAYQLRALPIGTVILSVLSLIFYACRFQAGYSASAIFLGFIGVAGSGLVILRFEYIATLSIATCIFIIGMLVSDKLFPTKAFISVGLVLFSTSASILVHPQGLLFLPLSAFVIYRVVHQLAVGKEVDQRVTVSLGLFSVAALVAIAASGAEGLGYCKGSDAMLNELNKLTIQKIPTTLTEIVDLLKVKISNYASSFLYKSEYQVNYLPGVVDATNQGRFRIVNLVLYTYIVGLLAFTCAAITATVISEIQKIFKIEKSAFWLTTQSSIAATLIALPGVFLIIYDNQQYFYRSIFINFIFSISSVLFLTNFSRLMCSRARYYFYIIFAFPLVLSLYFNYKSFYFRLPDWDAIYSMPGKIIGSIAPQDVMMLAEQCKINPSKGGLVVDGATYDALKHFSNSQLIWYVEYQSTVSNLSIEKIIEISQSQNVIASCNAMRRSGVGFPFHHRSGQLCCFNYANDAGLN